MNRIIFIGLAALVAVGFFSVQSVAETKKVVIENIKFNPDELFVKVGDKVEWENKDLVPHTVTSKGNFESKQIDPGKKWTHKFKNAGHYDYICSYHPNMKADLKVTK